MARVCAVAMPPGEGFAVDLGDGDGEASGVGDGDGAMGEGVSTRIVELCVAAEAFSG